jgi:magnesium-transporting ATPase (P-type)
MIAVSYAVGLLRIADVGALVYRSETIESLANVSVICFSSSGTLTGQQATLETIPPPPGYDHLSESRIRQILGDCLHSISTSQPIRLALARSFTGQARLFKEMAPFYTAFGWSGLSFELDDLRGTYVLGAAELLQPQLVSNQPDKEPARPDESSARPARSHRWHWLKRVWRPKSLPDVEPEESLAAPVSIAIEETKSIPKSNNGPILTASGNGNTSPTPEENGVFKEQWRARFRRWFAPKSVEPKTEVSAKPGQEPDGISLLFAYRPEAVPLYDEAGFPQLPSDLIPLGRVHLTEQVRPEAVAVLQAFVKAGVTIKILSADASSRLTDTVKQLGLSRQESPTRVISGAELHALDAATFARTIETEDFMAQLTPDQQAAIVKGLRTQGDYVAMVGNEVTDIPALQQANLRIASQTDSQAALTLADIVLLERSLQVLPNVFFRGQQIVNGLLDTFKLYLTHVAAQLLMIVIVIWLLAMPAPYSSTQASIVSFFAITMPAIFLPFWSSLGRVTRQAMIDQLRHFVLPAALTTMVLAVSLYAWYLRITANLEYARLVVTHALVATGFVRVIFVKPPTRFWVGGNPLSGDWRPVWMTVGAAAIYVAFVAITAAVPTFQGWFDLNALQRPEDYLVIALAVVLWAFITRTLWRFLRRYEPWFGADN